MSRWSAGVKKYLQQSFQVITKTLHHVKVHGQQLTSDMFQKFCNDHFIDLYSFSIICNTYSREHPLFCCGIATAQRLPLNSAFGQFFQQGSFSIYSRLSCSKEMTGNPYLGNSTPSWDTYRQSRCNEKLMQLHWGSCYSCLGKVSTLDKTLFVNTINSFYPCLPDCFKLKDVVQAENFPYFLERINVDEPKIIT